MRFGAQTADLQRPQPAWLRAVTLVCVLLASISTAQAAHIHGRWLPHSSPELTRHVTGSAAATEDACPLCAAMHSALPSHTVAILANALLLPVQPPLPVARRALQFWRYELFGRPPPALL